MIAASPGRDGARVLGAILTLLIAAEGAAAQVVGWSIGFVSSGVDWVYPPPPPSDYPVIVGASSNTDRRSVTLAASVRQELRGWLSVESGLRVVPKGFEVTGPTFHMVYAEVPLLGVLHTGYGPGLLAEGGMVMGVRVHCRRFFRGVDGPHRDGCGRFTSERYDLRPLRRTDLSWSVGLGARLGDPDRGWLGVVARLQRSLIDLDPGEAGRKMVNRVLTVSLFFERPRPVRR